MFHFLVLIIAISFLTFMYARRRASVKARNKYLEEYVNPELQEYLEMADSSNVTPNKLFKKLVAAAAILLKRQEELEKERKMMYPLFADRLVSYDLWHSLEVADEELGFERLSIEAEATRFKEFGKIFEVAGKSLGAASKPASSNEAKKDLLYQKRSQTLRQSLYDRLVVRE